MSKSENKKNTKRILDDSASIRGIERDEFFRNGGTPAQWRGIHSVHTSRSEKRKSRSSENKKAIEDSKESNK
jgi:hypothetical protein